MMPAPCARQIRVRGRVQGVGYRPFVWRLAHELGLRGWVRNDAEGVEILAVGGLAQIEALYTRLNVEAPPLAQVSAIELGVMAAPAAADALPTVDFSILPSRPGALCTEPAHDSAPCRACLGEVFDPANRRWRHAFASCMHCGPRYTVTRGLPYDRERTSYAPFAWCVECAREYGDPAARRFHAETIGCPDCGPRLQLLDAQGVPRAGVDPLRGALDALLRGEILALKGRGGFQLLCDARNAAAVTRLRERKERAQKPFAVLLANPPSAAQWVEVADATAIALLESAARPIVLLPKRPAADIDLPGLAPGLDGLGVLLPATPLHYLLFHEAAGRPSGLGWLEQVQSLALVCTSANPGGEPLVIDNAAALSHLADLADAFLLHDQHIVMRCDDSVLQVIPASSASGGRAQFIRRARGYALQPIALAGAGPNVLALGGWYKNTVCLTRGQQAFVSQHIGNLDNAATCEYLEETLAHLLAILDVRPDCVAHDLHPDFFSTRLAVEFAARHDLPLIGVQHHHAHVAAVVAEHGLQEPVIGLALDGVGLGSDGAAWGGELLRVEGAACARLGHLQTLALPGGERAALEPWRMAASALHALGMQTQIAARFATQAAAATVQQMLERGLNSPPTTSMGRHFDAAAGLLGVCSHSAYEGQAAMLLETLAARHPGMASMPALEQGYRIDTQDGRTLLDLQPLLRHLAGLADAAETGFGAALFHATLADALADWAGRAAQNSGIRLVVCAGGCCLNRVLLQRLERRLRARGLQLLQARQLPPNDAGLSLGQAWVARCQLAQTRQQKS